MTIERKTYNYGQDTVLCDFCNTDFTRRSDVGGILFGSKACCPECTPRLEESAKEHQEEHFIKARCPDGKSFADWVRQDLRGGLPPEVTVISAPTIEDLLKVMRNG